MPPLYELLRPSGVGDIFTSDDPSDVLPLILALADDSGSSDVAALKAALANYYNTADDSGESVLAPFFAEALVPGATESPLETWESGGLSLWQMTAVANNAGSSVIALQLPEPEPTTTTTVAPTTTTTVAPTTTTTVRPTTTTTVAAGGTVAPGYTG